jgi:hypothetical protein
MAATLCWTKVRYAVLDGQQRLTSVYQTCTGAAEETYYVDMARVESINQFDDECLSYKKRDEFEAEFGTRNDRAKRGIVRVDELYSESGFRDWCQELGTTRAERMDELFQDHLSGIRRYKFPALQLPDDLELKALVKIFDKLNRLGEELKTFDLMVARLLLAQPEKFRLRERWDEANKVYPDRFQPYRVDGMDILRLIALKVHQDQAAAYERSPKTVRISVGGVREDDVLDVDPNTIAKEWDAAVDSFAAAIKFAADEFGVVNRAVLPSATILLPLAVGLELLSKSGTRASFRDDVKTWYWCSVFRQTYAQGANTQAVSDAKALSQWSRASAAEPEAVAYFKTAENVEALAGVIRDRRNRNNNFLRGLMALFVLRGARDWRSEDGRPPVALSDHQRAFQFHHIFPEDWLEKRGRLKDPIVNFAVLTRSTNASLGKDAPSTVFERTDISHDAMADHRVDLDALKADDWDRFAEKRIEALLEMIRTVLPSPK